MASSSSSSSSSSASSVASSSSASSSNEDEFLTVKSKNTKATPSNKNGTITNSNVDHDDDDINNNNNNNDNNNNNNDNIANISINQKFAREYEQRKRREELLNHRKYDDGDDDDDDDDDSSDESEDEEGDLLTPQLDVQIIKTLRALKRKDGAVYDPNVEFFHDDNDDNGSDDDDDGHGNVKLNKKKRYKDVVREQILEQMANEDKNNGEMMEENEKGDAVSSLAYDEEQRDIRRAFLESTRDNDEDDDNNGEDGNNDKTNNDGEENDDANDNDWLKPKSKKTKSGKEGEDEAKRLWEEELNGKTSDAGGKNLVDPKGEIQDGDQFLLEFMTHRKWLDRDTFGSSGGNNGDDDDDDDGDDGSKKDNNIQDDDSLDDLERMDAFESKYNFRFEEAAAASAGNGGDYNRDTFSSNNVVTSGATHSIVHYARSSAINDALRRKDETRKQKRLARKERKVEERKAKEEQLRRLKNARRDELEERMQQVRNVLGHNGKKKQNGNEEGSNNVGQDLLGDGGDIGGPAPGSAEEEMILKLMEGDYDPEKFEAVMNAAYGEEYYQKEDEDWKTDQDVKRDLASGNGGVEEGILGDGEMYDDGDDDNAEEEYEEGYNDEAEQDDGLYDDEQWGGEKEQEDGVTTEMDQKLKSKMMDELYKLDYEDIIGDMPTRFKYRTVEANNYGLSTEEVLFAKDATLKQFVSLKKMAPYRDEEEYLPGTKKRKRFRQMLKAENEELLAESGIKKKDNGKDDNDGDDAKKKKRRRQKKGSKKNADGTTEDDVDEFNEQDEKEAKEPDENGDEEGKEKKSRRRKKKKGHAMDTSEVKSNKEISGKGDASDDKKDAAEFAHHIEEKGDAKKKKKKNKKQSKNKHSSGGDGGKKKRKHSGVEGVSAARLASYGM